MDNYTIPSGKHFSLFAFNDDYIACTENIVPTSKIIYHFIIIIIIITIIIHGRYYVIIMLRYKFVFLGIYLKRFVCAIGLVTYLSLHNIM